MAEMDKDKMIEKLNNLLALDIDAVNVYQEAIDRLDVEMVRSRLREFQSDHERHIRELSQVVARAGGKARTKPDLKGFLLKGFTSVSSMMGNEQALQAMRGNEQLTNRTYESALDESWPGDVRAIIERNYQDEQRHLAYIEEALRQRLWEQQPSAQA